MKIYKAYKTRNNKKHLTTEKECEQLADFLESHGHSVLNYVKMKSGYYCVSYNSKEEMKCLRCFRCGLTHKEYKKSFQKCEIISSTIIKGGTIQPYHDWQEEYQNE